MAISPKDQEDEEIQTIYPIPSPPSAKERALKALRNFKGAPTAFNPARGAYTDMAYELYKKLSGTQPLEDFAKKVAHAARDLPQKPVKEDFAKGGKVRKIDGCAQRGKTKGRYV